MRIYADTSALLAWFHPADEFATAVTTWCRERSPDFVWNSLLRVELRHSLRRLNGKYSPVAWHACRASETSQKLRMVNQRLSDLLEWGDELSARPAQESRAGTWDFVHVAAAQHIHSDIFVTCEPRKQKLPHRPGSRGFTFLNRVSTNEKNSRHQ